MKPQQKPDDNHGNSGRIMPIRARSHENARIEEQRQRSSSCAPKIYWRGISFLWQNGGISQNVPGFYLNLILLNALSGSGGAPRKRVCGKVENRQNFNKKTPKFFQIFHAFIIEKNVKKNVRKRQSKPVQFVIGLYMTRLIRFWTSGIPGLGKGHLVEFCQNPGPGYRPCRVGWSRIRSPHLRKRRSNLLEVLPAP